jgi:hypothetical protein
VFRSIIRFRVGIKLFHKDYHLNGNDYGIKNGTRNFLKDKREQEYSRFFYPNKTLNQQKFSVQPAEIKGFKIATPHLHLTLG